MRRFWFYLGTLVTALVLAGCMQGSPPVDPAGDSSQEMVSGIVQNWPGGTGAVRPVVTDETGTVVVEQLETTATISDDGSFQLSLPPTVDSEMLFSESICLGTFEGTIDPQSWGEFFAEMGVFQGDQYTGSLILASDPNVYSSTRVGDMILYRLFLDRAVTVRGTCSEEEFVQEYDAAAEAGWNYVLFEVLEVGMDGFPSVVRLTTPPSIPSGLDWYFVSLQGTAALR